MNLLISSTQLRTFPAPGGSLSDHTPLPPFPMCYSPAFLEIILLYFYFFFFGPTYGNWKFGGQGLNPHPSSDPSHCSDNARSLAYCTTRGPRFFSILKHSFGCSAFSDPLGTAFSSSATNISIRNHREFMLCNLSALCRA